MDKVINQTFGHIGENIFENFETLELLQLRLVSSIWKDIIDNVLVKRFKEIVFFSCYIGKTDFVKLILNHPRSSKIDLNVKDNEGNTPLIVACKYGHLDVIQSLLDHPNSKSIDINGKNNDGESPIMISCNKDYFVDIAELILRFSKDKNIEWNFKGNEATKALSFACFDGYTGVVQFIVDHSEELNVDLNAREPGLFGCNGFMRACVQEHYDIVKIFMDQSMVKNIDLNARTDFFFQNESIIILLITLGNNDMIQFLLEHQASQSIEWNATAQDGQTAFMVACQKGNLKVVELLLHHSESHNIDLNMSNNRGETGIMLACENGRTDVVKFLVDKEKIHLPDQVESSNYSQDINDLLKGPLTLKKMD